MLLLVTAALAARPTDFPATLVGGIAGTYAAPDGGTGLANGYLLVHFDRFTFQAGAGEGWGGPPSRHIGHVFVGGRVYSERSYLRVGFLHHHETAQDLFLEDWAKVLTGGSEGIDHRSGVELGVGFDYQWRDLDDNAFFRRWQTDLDLSVGWLPLSKGPPLYVGLEISQGIHVGKRRT